ncbi:MAG: response regulator transcription factor [Treponema sp.]|jgi:DNA-binding NarL/FixJ family response regulator|nr:response regulator transcription factor [Treponema sp.]
MPVIKVIIVEDHPLFSKGLISLIIREPPYMVVGEAKTAGEALELARTKNPSLAIVDLNLGEEDGITVIRELKREFPCIKILVLSMHDERYHAKRVLEAGAQGYIMKEEAGDNVLDAIKTVMSGEIYLSSTERERLFSFVHQASRQNADSYTLLRKLTDRQLQIFSLIGKGLGTIEIANKLSLSGKTVDAHKEHIKTKLCCASAQELRQLAIEWNSH